MIHVVDDNELLRHTFVDIIEGFGRTALQFACPKEYIRYVKSVDFVKPKAVFTDVHMPEMNGYDMMNEVLLTYPGINFAVMSGTPDVNSQFKDKACMFLAKPFKLELLQEMIAKFVQCDEDEPSTTIGCASCGSSERFGVKDFTCPKLKR